ncbi:hypothetical protein [Sphingobacterium thalpophilum]|uniref:hypothetical protein n=1 Tax=Sphingobacterium thalpophilum TaxID=259 RepID=UPI0024A7275B|nr:hypothetical protein [Sphingobacterium thalpophilum]
MIAQFKSVGNWKMLTLVALIGSFLSSCKESKDSVDTSGEATVSIRLLGVENPVLTNKKGSTKTSGTQSAQTVLLPFTKTSKVEATLTNESTTTSGNILRAASGTRAAAVEERTPLAANIKYMIAVYDADGNFIKENAYTNTVDNTAEMQLPAGKTYTFIAYSVNSTSDLPGIDGKASLTTASLNNISADLMYFKGSLAVQSGSTSTLNVVLKHKYSEVTTSLNMATDMGGTITALSGTNISPTHSSANLKLSDGSIAYNGNATANAAVVFPQLGAGLRYVSSIPTLLIHPGTTAGIFNIGSVTIDGETKNNVQVPGLVIVPGQRYNLNLNFKTCTQQVVGANLNWDYPQVRVDNQDGVKNSTGTFVPNGGEVSQTITGPGADYGFVFDITKLDNSFNMTVNGTKLSTQEIQFQPKVTGYPANVEFVDGSKYEGVNTEGGANVGAIWSMTGTTANPLIRLVIERNGTVRLYGSKVSNGPLYELKLTNGARFNPVQWNSATNTVKITQIVQGPTGMVGSGRGVAKVPCQ